MGGVAVRPSASSKVVFLLDTNVVSELRRPRPHRAVLNWLERVRDTELHVSAVTIGEIQAGIEITRESDPEKAAEITDWLGQIRYGYMILPMDEAAFACWAKLMHRRSDALILDAMIAATAITRNLTVVTRNTKDFAVFETPTFDPFANQ